MKITISQEQLSHGLQSVQNVVSTRSTLPILSNVLLRAENDALTLIATDLDITVSVTVEAKVEQPGATTLPAKRLFEIVRELGSADISIEVDDKQQCILQAGSSYFKMSGLAAEEFPPLPTFNENRQVRLKQEVLKDLFKKTSYATSPDASRFVLHGILMSLKDHAVTMVATDGRRLALAEAEVDIPPTSQGDCIIPNKMIDELNRLLGTGDVDILISPNQVAFKMPNVFLISKLIEGIYPNYKQVIPQETKERITLLREEFLTALRRASIMTSEKSNSVKVHLGRNTLSITANTPDVGEVRESMAINYQGKEFAIAFNPEFMMQPLKALTNDEVYLELIDELSPGLLKTQGAFLYVLMPMRMS